MKRVSQTRHKITWFGAIVFFVTIILGVIFKMEQVVITALCGITFIIGGYQASEGYTKAKFMQNNNQNTES